jgi:hypothetical protein
MSAFDALTKIKQAVTHPKTDYTLPKSRSLAFKAITDKAALQGTKGQHCTLVHGDHWEEVAGAVTDNIQKDRAVMIRKNHSFNVRGNQTVMIEGDHRETFAGPCLQSILGSHRVFNANVRNETRLGSYTEVYGKQEIHDDNNGKKVVGVNHDERFLLAVALHGLDLQSFGMAFSAVGATIPITGLNISAKLLLDYSLALVHTEFTGLHMESHLRHTEDHDGPPGI